jgi:hypothetical protein
MSASRTPFVPPAPKAADSAGPDEPALAGPAAGIPAGSPAGAQPRPSPTARAASERPGGAS